jgi:hypothetical protein
VTKTILKRTLLLALATTVMSSLSFASLLVCGSNQSVTLLSSAGVTGCTFGSNTFTNFSVAGSNEFGTTSPDAISPSTVQMTFTGATTNPGVVNVMLSNSDVAAWALTGSQQFDLVLTYTVTGSAAYFTQFADSFNGTATGAGEVSYDKSANGQILPTLVTPSSSNAPMSLGGQIQTFNVTDNIIVHASNATATLTNATNSFTMVSIVTNPAPEPMTSMMLGSGLLALGFVLRRKKRT